MGYNDDSFAIMLLTMALSPNREEYARPLNTQEFRRLEQRVRGSDMGRLGKLLGVDISGLMLKLDVDEQEAYRIFTLCNRGVQLTYALEGFYERRIRVVTQSDGEYPQRLTKRLGEAAPPMFYAYGEGACSEKPKVAVVGIGGVRTTPEARDAVETLVRNAGRLGYAVVTGGEPGVSHVAAGMAEEYGVELIEILGGGMGQRTAELAEAGELAARCSGISLEHPDALFTISHAITRNRVLFALSDAAIVFNTDGKRGESEAIVHGYCDWIYAWRGHASTQGLIARGAYPIDSFATLDMDQMARDWRSSRAEQLSMFDLFGE